jgi:CelD/BcsL family acetyltransferase involved in cellulose biosynthesis
MTELLLFEPFDPRVEQIWRRLEVEAKPAFFLSWGWIENWLACLPRADLPPLAVIMDGDAPVAAFFLGKRRMRRQGLGRSVLFFNTTGDERVDDVGIEHNGLLRVPSSHVTLETVIGHLPAGWDELFLPAVDRATLSELGSLGERYQVRIDREATAPCVDLELARTIEGGYLELLAPATRAQIHRSHREVGALAVEVAGDDGHARDIFDELLRLHVRHARSNAFANPWLERFHRRLIETRLRHGEIQLVRVRASDTTIGCLYNFVYGGRVVVYQSGFEQFADPQVKPGFVCHIAAIEHGAASGMAIYDLLAGDAGYKHRLSTGETRLLWLRVQRKLARFTLEHHLKGWKRALASWRQRRIDAGVPSRA